MQDRFRFRGQAKNGKWIFGSLLRYADEPQIWDKDGNNFIVKPETVGQCTGLKDKNGKLIFEGDILRVTGSQDTTGLGVVEYLQSGCQFNISGYLNKSNPYFPRRKGEYYQPLQEWLFTEIIGNIYQNPELLEQ